MVSQILLVMSKAMNEMYGSSEFFDNLNRQDYKDSNGNLDEGAFDAAFARYEDRSKVLFQRSFILYGGGAALVTTGLLMVLLAPDGADEPSFSFAPVPGGATLQTMTRF